MRQAVRLTLPVLLALAAPAGAAMFTVTKTADTLDGACNADCSLREAVTAANASPGADSIHLGPGIYALTRPGAYATVAATGDLDVGGSRGIQGAGADRVVIDGGGADRILDVLQDASLELRGVTVRNGLAGAPNWTGEQYGGGIRSTGFLDIADCVIADSRADSGGGISAFDLTLRSSTLTGNTGVYGGGLFVIGHVEMENVTLASNRSL